MDVSTAGTEHNEFQYFINLVKSMDYIDVKQNDKDYGPWNLYSIKRWYEEYII